MNILGCIFKSPSFSFALDFLEEDELTKVDLEDGEEYFKKHLVYGVSQLNKSSVTVDFGQACAMRMEVHRKREDENFNIVGTFNSASTKVNV